MHNPHNRLSRETSPYLLQHAENPVNWFPWGHEALQLAQQQDKPILLSIGYSACHWCHVMAHESFEDANTAALMNEYFINIKVDREERPDLDKIYQLAHQLLTGRPGGWPLTLVLMPQDQMPFFAGTYFPSQQRHGMRSFSDLLRAIYKAYIERNAEIQQQNRSLQSQLLSLSSSPPERTNLNVKPVELLAEQLLSQYDHQYGGFTPAPKFPHPFSVERTLRQARLYGQQYEDLLNAGLHSLRQMARGGLFDHIGGGFCRYSTDPYWMIPHFEKMLYDNGQLLPLYAWAHQLDTDYYIQQAVTQTAEWLMGEMQGPNGGYFSAQDADSEGEEGKYYVWTPQQTKSMLNEEEAQLFNQSYGLDRAANFEGKWYPHCYADLEQLAEKHHRPVLAVQQSIDRAKQKLYRQRLNRIHPATDDKVLTSWNALMIRGMNIAARVFKRADYHESANRALQFIQQTHWKDDLLYATSKGGRAHLNAYLDDYAYLLLAVIDALQNEWNNDLYGWSKRIADRLLALFEDTDQGGFYFTSSDHEQLIMRSKSFNDDAIPSGNGIAASALQWLGLLSGNTKYLSSAEQTLQAASIELQRSPILYCAMLNALDNYLNPGVIIILRGPTEAMKGWQQAVFAHYLPNVLCYAIDRNIQLTAELADKKAPEKGVCAYICEGFSCRDPITEVDQFKAVVKRFIAPSCQDIKPEPR